MKKGLIGKKIGMTQLFDENGKVIPVTVVEAGPCRVIQKKTIENDGYCAVQVGFGEKKEKHTTKAMQGHFKKAGTGYMRYLRELKLENAAEMNVGDEIKADSDTGVIVDLTTGKEFKTKPFPEFVGKIIADGGLIEAIKKGSVK